MRSVLTRVLGLEAVVHAEGQLEPQSSPGRRIVRLARPAAYRAPDISFLNGGELQIKHTI
jgi:hypothetical protein